MTTLIVFIAILIWIIFYAFFKYRENVKLKSIRNLSLRIDKLIKKSDNINKTTNNKFEELFKITRKKATKYGTNQLEQDYINIIEHSSLEKINEITAEVRYTISTFWDPIKNVKINKIIGPELIYADIKIPEYSSSNVKYEIKNYYLPYFDRLAYRRISKDKLLNI